MKNIYAIIAAALTLLMLLLPLASMSSSGVGASEKSKYDDAPFAAEKADTFIIKDVNTNQSTSVAVKDYIFGVVASEMPALYETEALKAQAVAAYTYALYKKHMNSALDYDLTNDPSLDQGFITRQAAREKWGENFAQYEQKIDSAVDDVSGIYISYNSSPILSAYHAISGGKTESSEDIWGKALPYLVPVDSIGDLMAKDYITSARFTADELKGALGGKCNISGDPSGWFGELSRSASGSIVSAMVCGTQISGADIRDCLSLRSSNFDILFADGCFEFTVKGYGHGIGMSQNGANYMAQQGSNYEEILLWYYKDCTLCKLE